MDLESLDEQPPGPDACSGASTGRTSSLRLPFHICIGIRLSYLHKECGGLIISHHDLKPSKLLVIGQDFEIVDLGRSHLRPPDGGLFTGTASSFQISSELSCSIENESEHEIGPVNNVVSLDLESGRNAAR